MKAVFKNEKKNLSVDVIIWIVLILQKKEEFSHSPRLQAWDGRNFQGWRQA